jgi:hypothetical protein
VCGAGAVADLIRTGFVAEVRATLTSGAVLHLKIKPPTQG